jgi:hypothetical protein
MRADRRSRPAGSSVATAPDASTLLVRPDGVVVWAGDGPTDVTELRQAAARWLGAPG